MQKRKRTELLFFERGPGPAAYTLPSLTGKQDHDVTHLIEPAHTLGLKLPTSFMPKQDVSPGPGAYLFPERCTRRGIGHSPAFSMREMFPIVESSPTPAPNYYKTPNTNVYKVKVPSFTIPFKRKLQNKMLSNVPPNKYELPPMFGPYVPTKVAAPAVTLKGDRKSKELAKNNNAMYDLAKPFSGPAFTMRIKPKESKWINKAGPGSYFPERVKNYPRPPKWPFGIRYNDFTKVCRIECDDLGVGDFKDPFDI